MGILRTRLGGWWFWDPVENASLMPWLLGLALLHSLMATEKQGVFSYWTTLFSLLAFAFSVLAPLLFVLALSLLCMLLHWITRAVYVLL